MKSRLFIGVLFLQVVWLIGALLTGMLPGWSMFAKLDSPPFELRNARTGVEVDCESYLPQPHFPLDDSTVKALAVFICEKEKKPLRLEVKAPEAKSYDVLAANSANANREKSCVVQAR